MKNKLNESAVKLSDETKVLIKCLLEWREQSILHNDGLPDFLWTLEGKTIGALRALGFATPDGHYDGPIIDAKEKCDKLESRVPAIDSALRDERKKQLQKDVKIIEDYRYAEGFIPHIIERMLSKIKKKGKS